MQSINASEIRVRDQVREDLNRKVSEFLKSGSITKVGTGTVKTGTRPQSDHIIAVAPTKRAERQQEKEALHAAIAELSHIEIAGVTLIRSAHEVSPPYCASVDSNCYHPQSNELPKALASI